MAHSIWPAGEGVATPKVDCTNVRVHRGVLLKRQRQPEGLYNHLAEVRIEIVPGTQRQRQAVSPREP